VEEVKKTLRILKGEEVEEEAERKEVGKVRN
jgi:hypothetical protein